MGMTDRDLESLERRVIELERRTNANVATINSVLQKAKAYDGGLDKRLDRVEQELNKLASQQRGASSALEKEKMVPYGIFTNALINAKNWDQLLETKIEVLRKQVDALTRNAKR